MLSKLVSMPVAAAVMAATVALGRYGVIDKVHYDYRYAVAAGVLFFGYIMALLIVSLIYRREAAGPEVAPVYGSLNRNGRDGRDG